MDSSQTAELLDEMECSDEEHRVLRWRLEQFLGLGFGLACSAVMAEAPIDLALARRLIAVGCPVETATQILL